MEAGGLALCGQRQPAAEVGAASENTVSHNDLFVSSGHPLHRDGKLDVRCNAFSLDLFPADRKQPVGLGHNYALQLDHRPLCLDLETLSGFLPLPPC
jgi:hypothetical protein